jgi:hypothetical protein
VWLVVESLGFDRKIERNIEGTGMVRRVKQEAAGIGRVDDDTLLPCRATFFDKGTGQ